MRQRSLALAPGADLDQVVVRVLGARLALRPDGALVLATERGEFVQLPPRTWSTDARGGRSQLPSRYVLLGADRFGFAVEGWNATQPLTVDPGLVWSGYLGGSKNDRAFGIVPGSSAITVFGQSASGNFPTTRGVYQTIPRGQRSAFVTRISLDGTQLDYSTYLGGFANENTWSLVVHPNDETTVVGQTSSGDFPTTPGAPQRKFGGGTWDTFVSRLSADGSKLVFSTFLGGSANEGIQGVHLDPSGTVTVGGWTYSRNLVTTPNALHTAPIGISFSDGDGMIVQYSSSGKLVYSSYFGGSGNDYVSGIASGSSGSLITFLLGTFSADLKVTANAFQSKFGGGNRQNASSGDVYIGRIVIGQSSTQLGYGSYFGGSGNEWPFRCDVDALGRITWVGAGATVPTSPGAFRTTSAASDGYVARLDPRQPAAQQLVYASYFGGSLWDNCWAMSVDGPEIVTIAGGTQSQDMPVTSDAWQSTFGGGNSSTRPFPMDGFVARMRMNDSLPAAQQLVYASYVGAPQSTTNELVWDARSGPDGVISIAGEAERGFPLTGGSFSTSSGSGFSAIVLRIVTPPGYTTFGAGCGASSIEPVLTALPRTGQTFTLRLKSSVTPLSGMLFFALQRLASPVALNSPGLQGCWLHALPSFAVPIYDASGTLNANFPIPADPQLSGSMFYNQALFVRPGGAFDLTGAGLGRIR